MQQPSASKVIKVGNRFAANLVFRGTRAPLGKYTSIEAAQCAYDAGKILVGGSAKQGTR